jgi:hypothetical protein
MCPVLGDCIVSLFLPLSISIARTFLEFVHGILISNTGSNNRRFGFDFLEGGRRNLEDADLFVEGVGVGVRVKELLGIKKKRRFLLLSHLWHRQQELVTIPLHLWIV